MPIRREKALKKVLEAVKEEFDNMHESMARYKGLLKQVLDKPGEHLPHKVYIAGIEDFALNDWVKGTELVGWRYLVKEDLKRPTAIELHLAPDGKSYLFAELDKSRFVSGMSAILKDKRIQKKLSGDDYTLSVLKVPSLYVFALWLRAKDKKNDLIIPIAPTPSFLKPWPRTYTTGEFHAALARKAKDLMKPQKISNV
jgi:hypothetical protein